jgi:hypothetical protein
MPEPSPDGVVVFEKSPYWGPELKRQFAECNSRVRECRSLSDLQPSAAELSPSLMLIVLDAAPAECLAWIGRQLRLSIRTPVIVVASAEFAELEWPLREAGIIGFVHDEIPGHRLAQFCLRVLASKKR